MRGARRSASVALCRNETGLLGSREKISIDIPADETRHLLEYQVYQIDRYINIPADETRHLLECQVYQVEYTKLPNPIHETRVLKLVFRTIPCLKFWALVYSLVLTMYIKRFNLDPYKWI